MSNQISRGLQSVRIHILMCLSLETHLLLLFSDEIMNVYLLFIWLF